MRVRTPLALIMLLAVLGGCSSPAGPGPGPTPPAVRWTELDLPIAGATIRDIARCGDRWLAAGAVRLAADPTAAPNEQRVKPFQPAAWLSDPATGWRRLAMLPVSYYGERAILRSVACRDGVIVAVGAASGGAHGNARITTWHGTAQAAALAENPDGDFELFGGPDAIDVGRIAAGPVGFTIGGNRLNSKRDRSATVWYSADGHGWTRLPDDPSRSSTGTVTVRATDMYGDSSGYLLAGEQQVAGRITPYLLRSSDGRDWARVAVSDDGGLLNAGSVLVGAVGSDVLVWRDVNGLWSSAGEFTVDGGPVPVQTGGSGRFGTHTAVAACGGTSCGVWAAADGSVAWTKLAGPQLPPPQSSTTYRLATDGTTMLLLSDNGTNTHILLGEPAS